MFRRNLETWLLEWKQRVHRKPLVIRGARQVGKTSVAKQFGRAQFEGYIELNLEKNEHFQLFEIDSLTQLLQHIELVTNQRVIPGKTLLFIDEIQRSAKAIQSLRYFYEELPELHVIAAGSLLEVKIEKEGFSFPVGRVEFAYLFPATFSEFLLAMGKSALCHFLDTYHPSSAITDTLHQQLTELYTTYMAIGGMPEVVWQYSQTQSILDLSPIYDSLYTSYLEDCHKYNSQAKAKYVHHVLDHLAGYAGGLVTYEKFGESRYKAREISEAFSILETAMLLKRIWATSSVLQPLDLGSRKPPKVVFLHIGLVNYRLGIQRHYRESAPIDVIYKGQMAEQMVGQTLLALFGIKSATIGYWYREKRGSNAEVDFIFSYQGRILPLEVKSGSTGTLKSLHQFMEVSPSSLAIRLYAGKPQIQSVMLPSGNKSYTLISLPFYLTHQLLRILGLLLE